MNSPNSVNTRNLFRGWIDETNLPSHWGERALPRKFMPLNEQSKFILRRILYKQTKDNLSSALNEAMEWKTEIH